MTKALQKILFIPDCHHPFVDVKAWRLLLKVGRAWQPDRIVILGDFADAYEVSDHDKNPGRKHTLLTELEATNAALDEVQALGAKRVDYVMGNHEFRMDRFITKKAPELYGLVDMPGLLHLKQRGIHVTPYRQSLKLGKFYITHDRGIAGADAHRRTMHKYGAKNTIIGHTHRIATHYQGNALGECHVGAMFGWLGDVGQITYDHRDNSLEWSLGFGTGLLEKSGNMHIAAHAIVDYTVAVHGQVIR